MKLLRSFAISFSIYSRIPMPRFSWEEEDMRYHMIFFPWVGMVIGGLEYLLLQVVAGPELPMLFRMAIAGAIPLLVTGGFHVDGFMDVRDAQSSYQSKEKKLEILKDPHVGAFAVISLLIYVLLFGGALSLMLACGGAGDIALFALLFPLCRALSAILALRLKKAKPDGMLRQETKDSGKGGIAILVVELLAFTGLMVWIDPVEALVIAAVMALFSLYYSWKMHKEFGGVTGDTAGYFLTVAELLGLIAIGAWSVLCR